LPFLHVRGAARHFPRQLAKINFEPWHERVTARAALLRGLNGHAFLQLHTLRGLHQNFWVILRIVLQALSLAAQLLVA